MKKSFREILFDANEHTCFARTKYDVAIYPVEKISDKFAFLTLNPIAPGKTRADSSVATFRNILIEIDSLPVDEQQEYIQSLGFPYSTATYSGGKSIHFICSLKKPLASKEEYDKLVWRVLQAIPKADQVAKNCSRLTRNPGHFREDKQQVQTLLHTFDRVDNDLLVEWLDELGIPASRPVSQSSSTSISKMRGVLSKRARAFLLVGARPGYWNTELFYAANEARRNNYTQEEFERLASKITGTLDKTDLESIRSAFARKD